MTILIEVNAKTGEVDKITSINGGFVQTASVHELKKSIEELISELLEKHKQGWMV
jgi:hypothetical protein